jgi:PRTRC genetic system protein C
MADQKVIRYGDREMPLEPGMTLDQAKELMARHFPELADPKVETKKDGDKTTYIFSKKAGHKGSSRRRAKARLYAALLRRLQKLPAVPVVDPAIVRASKTTRGQEYVDGLDAANELRTEIAAVTAAREALSDLPTSRPPAGSVL